MKYSKSDYINILTITEFEINSPEEFEIFVTPNQILCYGEYGSADLSISGGTPPYEFLWTNQSTGEEVDPSMLLGGESGITYNVEVIDQNECIQVDSFIINPEPDEIEEMIDEADADGSGSINFPEFIELMLKNQTRGQTKDEIKQVQNLALGLEILTLEAMFESFEHICKQYRNCAIVVSNSTTKPSFIKIKY